MKKRYTKSGLVIILFLSGFLMAYHTGSPGGKTNAPGEGSCGEIGCHQVGAATMEFISSDIPAGGYVPGNTYTIFVSPAVEGVDKYGFELVAYNEAGTKLAGMTGSTEVTVFNFDSRATHKLSSTPGIDGRTWEVGWTAPTAGNGKVTFYASSIAANGDNTNNGDMLFKDSYSVNEAGTAGVSAVSNIKLSLYPNPVVETLYISGIKPGKSPFQIFNLAGEKVMEGMLNTGINVSTLSSGTYILKITKGNTLISKRFIKA